MSELLTMQDLANGHLDIKVLGEAANGDENTIVTTRTGNTYPSAERAINIMFQNGGLPATPFKTKALMTASALVDGKYAMVTNDAHNNGLYVKTAGAWVKSEYDPLIQAKAYTDTSKTDALNTVSERLKAIAEIKSVSSNAYVFADPDDKVLATLSSDAVFKANDFEVTEGTLSEALKGSAKAIEAGIAYGITDDEGSLLFGVDSKADVISPHPPVAGFGIDAVRSQLLDNASINNAGAYLERVSSQHLEPMNFDVDVALHGTDGKEHVRMGTMHKISDTLFYVTFMQFSVANQDYVGDLVARFVTVDWETQTATVGETIPLGKTLGLFETEPYKSSSLSHLFDVKDGVLLVAVVSTTAQGGMKVYKSVDNCQTWTKVGNITTPELLYPSLDSVALVPDGIYKDRLLFAGYTVGSSDRRLIGVYSDDFGATWQTGYNISPTEIGMPMEANEAAVTTDSNNNFIFVIRHELSPGVADKRKMYFAKSTDGGKTIKEFVPDSPTFGDRCAYGMQQRAPHSWDGVPSIAITHPSRLGRKGLRLYLSHNNCASWTKEYQLIPETVKTGYTSIKNIDQHTLGIVYEYGDFNAFSNVAIKFINNAEIYK
ncbi:sialidase family protein [Psychrobacter sp. Marseille-P5312]|uniref:sialidase family protein n=1 Tax=Psychrobacter sp. Marseille-P5312 TaxID=2086574 RepID=UPI000CF6617D|nr:sialidase family protein [Psychrobacter sp. Marseille-P5312]